MADSNQGCSHFSSDFGSSYEYLVCCQSEDSHTLLKGQKQCHVMLVHEFRMVNVV